VQLVCLDNGSPGRSDQTSLANGVLDDVDPTRSCRYELAPALPAETKTAAALQAAPPSLLPPEQCHPKALKVRFGSAAAAHTHLETILGPAPSKKKTWDYLCSVFASGSWPAPAQALTRPAAGRGGGAGARGEEALAQLETRLLQRIDQLEDHLIAVLEKVLQGKS
jgi:hypothetical protein